MLINFPKKRLELRQTKPQTCYTSCDSESPLYSAPHNRPTTFDIPVFSLGLHIVDAQTVLGSHCSHTAKCWFTNSSLVQLLWGSQQVIDIYVPSHHSSSTILSLRSYKVNKENQNEMVLMWSVLRRIGAFSGEATLSKLFLSPFWKGISLKGKKKKKKKNITKTSLFKYTENFTTKKKKKNMKSLR